MSELERSLNEKITAAALAGRASSPEVSRERAREIIEARMQGCIRVTGMTPAALSREDPERYSRWLDGNRKALVRESLKVSGELNAKSLQWLWRREKARRAGRDVDAVNDDFDGMFDSGLEDPRLIPASREFLDDGEDESERRFP